MDVTYNYYSYYSYFWKQPVIKKGDLYNSIKNKIRPFDVVMFKGGNIAANVICEFERRGKKISACGDFSHCGMVVTSDIINEPLLEKGKLYILESTLGGLTTDGVKDINGKTCFGVQLRDLDKVVAHYDVPNNTHIAWCPIINNPLDATKSMDEIKDKMTNIYKQVIWKMYDYNLFDFASVIIPLLRPLRPYIDKIMRSEDLFFCSELIAHVYIGMEIYPDYVIPLNTAPDDLIHPEEDPDKLRPPKIVNDVNYITTDIHVNKF